MVAPCAQGDVDMMRSFTFSRYLSPLFTLSFAIFVVRTGLKDGAVVKTCLLTLDTRVASQLILLFNLLIAVMSEGYEDVRGCTIGPRNVVADWLGLACRSRTRRVRRGASRSSR